VDRNRLYQDPDLNGRPGTGVNQHTVADYRNRLGLNTEPRILRVPHDSGLTVNDPVSRIPAANRHGFSDEELNQPIGQAIGMQPHQLDGSNVQDHLDRAGGGGYNHNTGVTTLDDRTDDNTLYHELGHQRQNQDGFNDSNTNRMALEYHNVIHHENTGPAANPNQPRIDYGLGRGPLYPRPGETWDAMRNHPSNTPQTNQVLDQIAQTTNGMPDGPLIRQNLTTQYFRYQREQNP
jgi:hypothetical protein